MLITHIIIDALLIIAFAFLFWCDHKEDQAYKRGDTITKKKYRRLVYGILWGIVVLGLGSFSIMILIPWV